MASSEIEELRVRVSYLTHWGLDKITDILQATPANEFCLKKTFELHIKFDCNTKSNWQCVSIDSDNGFAPNMWQGIAWNNRLKPKGGRTIV